jgi:hypothetical protein
MALPFHGKFKRNRAKSWNYVSCNMQQGKVICLENEIYKKYAT